MREWMEMLERAKTLLDAGALTPEEFEAEKSRILPRRPPHEEDEVNGLEPGYRSHSLPKRLGVIVVACSVIGSIGFFYTLNSNHTPPHDQTKVENSKSASTNSIYVGGVGKINPSGDPAREVTKMDIAAIPAQPHHGTETDSKDFQCIGPYSNVTFSEESGDGSGIFLRVVKNNDISLIVWEGSVSTGKLEVINNSYNSLSGIVKFSQNPDDIMPITLICRGDHIEALRKNSNNTTLKRINERQASELEI